LQVFVQALFTRHGSGRIREKVIGTQPVALSYPEVSPLTTLDELVISSFRIITGRSMVSIKEPPCTERYARWCERTDRGYVNKLLSPIFLLDWYWNKSIPIFYRLSLVDNL